MVLHGYIRTLSKKNGLRQHPFFIAQVIVGKCHLHLSNSFWHQGSPQNFSLIFFKFYLFILRERERMGRGGAEKGRERIPSRFRADSAEPAMGLELTNREIVT